MALPEPVWTAPQQVEFDPSSLCSTGTRPSYITGYLLRLLENHFSRTDNIVDPNLRTLIWEHKGAAAITSRILITGFNQYSAADLQQRPAIYIRRGEVSFGKLLMHNRALNQLSANGNLDGSAHYVGMSGSHDILCANRGPDDMPAERLAEEVLYMLLEYGPVIKQDLKVNTLQVAGMAPAGKIEEEGANYVVGIRLSWAVVHSWLLKQEAPVLRDVRFAPAG